MDFKVTNEDSKITKLQDCRYFNFSLNRVFFITQDL